MFYSSNFVSEIQRLKPFAVSASRLVLLESGRCDVGLSGGVGAGLGCAVDVGSVEHCKFGFDRCASGGGDGRWPRCVVGNGAVLQVVASGECADAASWFGA